MNSESKHNWREFFLLEQRLEKARREGFGASDPGWAEFVLGRALLSDANQLAQVSDGATSALLLYRAAVVLFADAHRARPAEHIAVPEGQEPPLRLPVEEAAVAKLPEEQQALVRDMLAASPAELHLAKLPDSQRQLALRGMQQAARDLADSLETQANRVRRAVLQRRVRLGVPIALAGLLIAWIAVKLLEPTNLALNKSVQISKPYPHEVFPPEKVVDGDRENLGFHTACERDQWLRIDLARVETIRNIRVFNRTDCCKQRSVPLKLELSSDGENYDDIDRRTTQFDEWAIEMPPTQARYVRLTNESANCFHLSEVEVY